MASSRLNAVAQFHHDKQGERDVLPAFLAADPMKPDQQTQQQTLMVFDYLTEFCSVGEAEEAIEKIMRRNKWSDEEVASWGNANA